jgi:hypothetical protein
VSALDVVTRALQQAKVTPVTPGYTDGVTTKPVTNQRGYTGYTGYTEKTATGGRTSSASPLRRYRVTVEQDGEQRAFTMLSPAEHGEEEALAAAYFHFAERLVAVEEIPLLITRHS